jgi:hypothetical protein
VQPRRRALDHVQVLLPVRLAGALRAAVSVLPGHCRRPGDYAEGHAGTPPHDYPLVTRHKRNMRNVRNSRYGRNACNPAVCYACYACYASVRE